MVSGNKLPFIFFCKRLVLNMLNFQNQAYFSINKKKGLIIQPFYSLLLTTKKKR